MAILLTATSHLEPRSGEGFFGIQNQVKQTSGKLLPILEHEFLDVARVSEALSGVAGWPRGANFLRAAVAVLRATRTAESKAL